MLAIDPITNSNPDLVVLDTTRYASRGAVQIAPNKVGFCQIGVSTKNREMQLVMGSNALLKGEGIRFLEVAPAA